jgi:hypothetical protein
LGTVWVRETDTSVLLLPSPICRATPHLTTSSALRPMDQALQTATCCNAACSAAP